MKKLSTVLEIIGATLVVVGIGLFNIPLALIVAGAACAAIGYVLGGTK